MNEEKEAKNRKKIRRVSLFSAFMLTIFWLISNNYEVLQLKYFYDSSIKLKILIILKNFSIKAIAVVWIFLKSKQLNINPFLWSLFGIISPLFALFLIGISQDPYVDDYDYSEKDTE